MSLLTALYFQVHRDTPSAIFESARESLQLHPVEAAVGVFVLNFLFHFIFFTTSVHFFFFLVGTRKSAANINNKRKIYAKLFEKKKIQFFETIWP